MKKKDQILLEEAYETILNPNTTGTESTAPKEGVVLHILFDKQTSGTRDPLKKKEDYITKLQYSIEKGKTFGAGNPLRFVPKDTKIEVLDNSLKTPNWEMTVLVPIKGASDSQDKTLSQINKNLSAELIDLSQTCGAFKTKLENYHSVKYQG